VFVARLTFSQSRQYKDYEPYSGPVWSETPTLGSPLQSGIHYHVGTTLPPRSDVSQQRSGPPMTGDRDQPRHALAESGPRDEADRPAERSRAACAQCTRSRLQSGLRHSRLGAQPRAVAVPRRPCACARTIRSQAAAGLAARTTDDAQSAMGGRVSWRRSLAGDEATQARFRTVGGAEAAAGDYESAIKRAQNAASASRSEGDGPPAAPLWVAHVCTPASTLRRQGENDASRTRRTSLALHRNNERGRHCTLTLRVRDRHMQMRTRSHATANSLADAKREAR